MWKLGLLIHVFIWPVVMSVMMIVALAIPAAQDRLGLWLGICALASFVAATPLSVAAAKAGARILS